MTVLNRQTALKLEALRLKLEAETTHGLKLGDILYSSWGYDQTNIDYYQVVAVTKAGVSIRPIGKKVVGDEGGPSEKVMPTPDDFTGPPMKKKVNTGYSGRPEGFVRISSYASAYKWDGGGKHQTGSHYGH